MCDRNFGTLVRQLFHRDEKSSETSSAHDFLLATISPGVTLPADAIAFIRSAFVQRSYRKGEVFTRAGQVTRRGGFVAAGCFRTYLSDSSGRESIIDFSPEGGWIGDLDSARTGKPTLYHVEAIEPSKALLIDIPTHDRMMDLSPEVARGYRMGLERSRSSWERRLAMQLIAPAEERYHDFIETNPEMANRVPQHMLASYLGMTPETLSRIRTRRRVLAAR